MESLELHDIGAKVFGAFEELLMLSNSQLLSKHRYFLDDGEHRFKLWAHSLGLHQHGHASLDYRVRDSTFVKERLAQLLSNLQEHLENLVEIVTGKRRPIEDCDQIEDRDINEDDSTDEESDNESSTTSGTESESSGESYSSSFHEVDFRFDKLTENIGLLYSLAAQIRSPRNRPQRPVDQLYKHVPAEGRDEHIKECENFETTIAAHAQKQQIIEQLDPRETADLQLSPAELAHQYTTTSYWLIRRAGIANARRKQQFVSWKEHALRLSQTPIPHRPTTVVVQHLGATGNTRMGATPNTLTPDATAEQIASVPLPSLTTSATHLRASDIESSDRDSIFSKRSRVSTVMNLNGERLEWPSPPTQIPMIGHFFTCPYCKVICPRRYLDRSSWQVHLIHDLQPYHCTYEDCTDPNRLYGTRKEWLDHENQHTQVWHCQEHTDELEFETLTEYVEHLKISHPDAPTERYSQELIRTMVAPSRKLRRECPFCPFLPNSSPDRVTEMQKHITFHLERLALLALPLVDDDSDGLDCSLNSPEIQRFGRKSSIAADFSEEERISFADFMYIEETQEGDHPVSDDNIREITLMDDNFRVQHWLPEDDSLFDDPPNQEIVPLEEFPIEYKEANGSTRPREKRLGLDDLERVRIIRDRGESDFYRAYSHVSQQSDIHTPLPGDVDTLLETMLQELEESKVMCALDPTKYYLPRRRLPEILTTQRVRTIVELPCFRDYPDKDDLTKNICLGPSPCLKLLAVLIITSKAHDLPRHMKEGLTDKCLPMDSKSSMYCRYHRNLHSTVNTYHTPTVQEFSRWSYSLVAPYIKNNTVKHPHYILRHDDVFPMEVFGQQMSDTGPTIPLDEGFDQVYQVKIDSSHYDFGAFGVHHHSGLFALKGLFSSDRENFSQELAALLFSMDNAHEQDAMDHLTQPLATFEVLDPRTRHTTYYFLFDWADGNLRDFWRTNQYLVGDMRHSLWMSQQFHKICLALQCLHNERETSAGIAPTDQLYGRHGEIKPDNIVWFHLEHSSSDHFLALSDFGSAHLDTQMSRSYQDARRSAHTITYSAPESNLSDGAISYATDIFSLGCVFLEYVTWVLCGLDSVENQFPNYRLEGDASGFITDKFFAIQSDVNGVQRPLLKPQVRNWISRLQQHANCSWYLYQLLEIIRDKMLEPDREKRVHILPLIEEMQKLRMACELNDSFYLKTRYS